MDDSYERQLAEIVTRLPRRPCVVALLPTIPLDQAAALASDVAQSIGAAQPGHTLLTSFEEGPARLDHEIGVEDGRGLTDVLSKRAAMAEVAAHGRARRFIYVPAGSEAAAGVSLLRSPGWRALSQAAVRGGGTVLALVPADVFVAAFRASDNGSANSAAASKPLFDALVWLGPARGPTADIREAALASGALDLGSVQLPGMPVDSGDSAPQPSEPDQDPSAAVAPPARSTPIAILGSPNRRQLRREANRRAVRMTLVLLLLGLLGAAAAYFVSAWPQHSDGPQIDIPAANRP